MPYVERVTGCCKQSSSLKSFLSNTNAVRNPQSPGRACTIKAESFPQWPRFEFRPGILLHVKPSLSLSLSNKAKMQKTSLCKGCSSSAEYEVSTVWVRQIHVGFNADVLFWLHAYIQLQLFPSTSAPHPRNTKREFSSNPKTNFGRYPLFN